MSTNGDPRAVGNEQDHRMRMLIREAQLLGIEVVPVNPPAGSDVIDRLRGALAACTLEGGEPWHTAAQLRRPTIVAALDLINNTDLEAPSETDPEIIDPLETLERSGAPADVIKLAGDLVTLMWCEREYRNNPATQDLVDVSFIALVEEATAYIASERAAGRDPVERRDGITYHEALVGLLLDLHRIYKELHLLKAPLTAAEKASQAAYTGKADAARAQELK